jgi:lipoprotein-anchoring transpeptidase ErfK/SrfK
MLPHLSRLGFLALALIVAACAPQPEDVQRARHGSDKFLDGYGPIEDSGYSLPGVDPLYTEGVNRRAVVPYTAPDPAGSIVVDPFAKFLFYVVGDGSAVRYPIAVGREGKGFTGSATIRRKEVWPGWQPTANMIRNEPEIYGPYRNGVEGGLRSPLGARALYLYRGGRDTYFRIHGTNDLPSIGHNSSAGCIRLFNHDIIELYERVDTSTTVRVRTLEESILYEGAELAHRGDDMAPTVTSIDGSTTPLAPGGLPVIEPDA